MISNWFWFWFGTTPANRKIFEHEDGAHLLFVDTTLDYQANNDRCLSRVRFTTASSTSPMDISLSNRHRRTNRTITSWWWSGIIRNHHSSADFITNERISMGQSMVDTKRSTLTNKSNALVFFTLIQRKWESEIIKDATRTNKRDIYNFSTPILHFEFDSIRFDSLNMLFSSIRLGSVSTSDTNPISIKRQLPIDGTVSHSYMEINRLWTKTVTQSTYKFIKGNSYSGHKLTAHSQGRTHKWSLREFPHRTRDSSRDRWVDKLINGSTSIYTHHTNNFLHSSSYSDNKCGPSE